MFYKALIKNIGLIPLLLLIVFLLNPFSLGLYTGYFIILYLIVFRKRDLFNSIDSDSLILLTFSLIYSAFDFLNGHDRGIQLLIVQSLFPFFFYCMGKCLIINKLTQRNIFVLSFLLVFVFSLSSMAAILKDLSEGGFLQVNRDFKSIWDGTVILATGMAGYLIYNVSIPIFLITKNKLLNVIEKALLLIVFLTTLVCSFRLGSRTIIVLSLFSLLFGIIYQLGILNKKDKFKFIVHIAILTVVLIYIVPFDIEADYFSTLGHRLNEGTSSNESAGGRTELWSNSFDKVFTHPLGWDSEKYGHNMWLDTAKVSGVIALIFLLIFTVKSVVNVKKVFLAHKLDVSLKLCLGLFTVITLIFFFGEPILEGNIYLFIFFCLQQGIIKETLEFENEGGQI